MTVRKRAWRTKAGARRSAWLAEFYGPDGRKRRGQFTTKAQAEEWESAERQRVQSEFAEAERTPQEQREAIARATTVAEGVERWLEGCKLGLDGNPPVEPTTYEGYRNSGRKYIIPAIGNLKISELTGPIIVDFRANLIQKASRNTAKIVLKHLTQMLNRSVTWGLIVGNPATAVKIKNDTRSGLTIFVPEDRQVQLLLDACDRIIHKLDSEVARCKAERPRDPKAGEMFLSRSVRFRGLRLQIKILAITGLRISESGAAVERNRSSGWRHLREATGIKGKTWKAKIQKCIPQITYRRNNNTCTS